VWLWKKGKGGGYLVQKNPGFFGRGEEGEGALPPPSKARKKEKVFLRRMRRTGKGGRAYPCPAGGEDRGTFDGRGGKKGEEKKFPGKDGHTR